MYACETVGHENWGGFGMRRGINLLSDSFLSFCRALYIYRFNLQLPIIIMLAMLLYVLFTKFVAFLPEAVYANIPTTLFLFFLGVIN